MQKVVDSEKDKTIIATRQDKTRQDKTRQADTDWNYRSERIRIREPGLFNSRNCTDSNSRCGKDKYSCHVIGDIFDENGYGSAAGRVYGIYGLSPCIGASHFNQVKYILVAE